MAEAAIQRRQLMHAILGSRTLTSVDVREISLQPGQMAGRHLHPCPVVGFILAGTALYQIEGEAEQQLPAGSAFYEPADKVVSRFGNGSDTEPMTFLAFYLLNGEQELITMLQNT
jgi:quercetin dioxygenase-like cupin family protein